MNDHQEPEPQENETPAAPTQEDLYDDLKRIGQLEDQKKKIQAEIDEKTDRLKSAIPSLDPSSFLYEMLSKAMKPAPTAAKRKSTPKKKTTRKRK